MASTTSQRIEKSLQANHGLHLLHRQYFQLVLLKEVRWPSIEILKLPESQSWIYMNLFNNNQVKYPLPPERYQLQFLKRLVDNLQAAFEDVDNDEISDELTVTLALLMSKPRVSELVAAQQKKYVTYVFPAKSGQDERAITLLESRTVISASGTTGLRTWEAALHLGTFLATKGASYVDGKCVLELGSGTGLIAALCARHMNARYVLATDGSPEVVEALEENMFLNGLEDEYLVKSRLLRWGRYLDDDNEGGEERHFNTVLGADVTFDSRLFPLLIASFRIFFGKFPNVDIIISAAVRNDDTFSKFLGACDRANLEVCNIHFDEIPECEQTGPFYESTYPIRIVQVKSLVKSKKDIVTV